MMPSDETMPPASLPATAGRRRSLAGPAAVASLAVSALCLGTATDWLAERADDLRQQTIRMTQDALLRASEERRSATLFVLEPDARSRLNLTATAYCATCLDDGDGPQPSALGAPVQAGRTVAVSRDLRHLLGRKIAIEGFGVRVVEDLMHPRFAKRLDLCLPDKRQALAFGVQNLTVVVLD